MLTKTDLANRLPLSSDAIDLHKAVDNTFEVYISSPADSVHAGTMRNKCTAPVTVEIYSSTAAAAGESMVVTVKRRRGGSTATLGTVTFGSSSSAGEWISALDDFESADVVEGDVIIADFNYTAGGSPTPMTDFHFRFQAA